MRSGRLLDCAVAAHEFGQDFGSDFSDLSVAVSRICGDRRRADAGSGLHLANAMRKLYGLAVFVLVTADYALAGPLYPIAVTLFYYDQRIRHEGYDIERMMETAGLNTAATLVAEAEPVAEAGVGEGQP